LLMQSTWVACTRAKFWAAVDRAVAGHRAVVRDDLKFQQNRLFLDVLKKYKSRNSLFRLNSPVLLGYLEELLTKRHRCSLTMSGSLSSCSSPLKNASQSCGRKLRKSGKRTVCIHKAGKRKSLWIQLTCMDTISRLIRFNTQSKELIGL
jgi:hypothetical protein